MKRKIENLLISKKELDKWIACYAKGLPVSIAGVDFTIKDLGKTNDLIGGYIATVESTDNYPCCFNNEDDMATKIIKSHDPILSVDAKYLSHRGRRAKEQAEMDADRRQWADLSDRQQESREAVSHHRTYGMDFDDAMNEVLIRHAKVCRRKWFGKLIFRNDHNLPIAGDYCSKTYPAILALEVGVRQSEFASWKTYDAMSNYFSNEDKEAHDWEVVECTLPWEE